MFGPSRGTHRRARHRRVVPALVAAAATTLGLVAAAPHADATVGVPTTYEDFSYASTVHTPSENKPQSKLWYTDGFWWALMVAPGGTDVHIFKLNRQTHTWGDTGTVVDTRLNSTGDALWTASDRTLAVVSRDNGANARVARFTYSPASDTYTVLDSSTVNTGGGSESATIDRDSTGRLWITYTRASRLWVAHSDTTGHNWGAGYNPAVGDYTLASDDISSLIAFNGSIGLMWSDQQSGAMRFAIHQDGDGDQTWSVENALAGTRMADDHINLKQVAGDAQGRIFAAIKTSQGDDPGDPDTASLVGVLVRTPGAGGGPGTWELVPAGTVKDDHTRPIIMIDQTNQELYFFATAPVSGGDIYYKKTSLAHPDFSDQPGRGAKFVDATPVVNNASGAKDPVTAESGMVILAVAEGKKKYVHAEMDLQGGGGSQDTEKPSVPTGLSGSSSAGKVDLTWNASTDNVDVTGYIVKRGSSVVGNPSQPSFTDNTVSPGTAYTYTVQATDAAGNVSAASDPVTVTVPDEPPPSGDISLRDATTARNVTEKTIVVPVPARQAGDLLLATVDFRGKGSITAPAGWTLLRKDVNGTAMQKATFWRLAGANEPPSYTWTFSAKPTAVASMLAYAGVSSSAPIQASSAGVTAKSKDISAPSVTASSGSVVVGLFGLARAATIANPGGTTELTEITSSAGTAYPMTAETAMEMSPSAGATGGRIAHSSVSGPSIGQLVVLTPA